LTAQSLKKYNGFMLRDRQSITITIFSTLVPAFSFLIITSFLADSVSAQSRPNTVPGSSSSAYRLIGTIEGRSFTGAVLDDTTGKQSFYRVRELLPDGSLLVKVRDNSITVKSADGALYDVYVSRDNKSASIAVLAPPAVTAAIAEPQINQPALPEAVEKRHQRAHTRRALSPVGKEE
jgi:hypothetical protein